MARSALPLAATIALAYASGESCMATSSVCETHCETVPCRELNGDIRYECGGCRAGATCHPCAHDFLKEPPSFEKRRAAQSTQPMPLEGLSQGCDDPLCHKANHDILTKVSAAADSVVAADAATAVHSAYTAARSALDAAGLDVPCELQRIDAAALHALSAKERVKLFATPTVVTGLNDEWPAFRTWASPRNFSSRFGDHSLLAKRASFSYSRVEKRRANLSTAEVRLSEVIEHAASEHLVMLDEETGSRSEAALQAALTQDYTVPPILECASLLRVWSFGGGRRGVEMMQHMVAWLATVAGAKLWYLADPALPQPSGPQCGAPIDYASARQEGVRHCLILPGEIMIVPDHWWHATCNLLPYTVAVGGQLWATQKQYEESTVGADESDSVDSVLRLRPLNPYQESLQPLLLQGDPIPDLKEEL